MTDILKQLVAPCGLIWLGLILATLISWRSRNRLMLIWHAALLVAYTGLGNIWIGATLMSWLDTRHAAVDSLDAGPFDAVCVLGGGTFRSPHGRAQLAGAGDRVMLGARLYLTGRTKMLMCTGSRDDGPGHDVATECAEVWRDLNIPAQDIIQAGGRNTTAEIEQIRLAIQEHGWKRVGLVTSSWHMRRAVAYAKSRGVQLDPLPAAVSGKRLEWNTRDHAVPQAKGFVIHQFALKELLAAECQKLSTGR